MAGGSARILAKIWQIFDEAKRRKIMLSFVQLQTVDFIELNGLPGGTRTPDLLLRRQLLYPVELRAERMKARRCGPSLCTKWSERRDSNSRPSAPKADALPGCATLRRNADSTSGGAGFQRRWYCVWPNSTSFSASVRTGWRSSASTCTPRCTAGRSPMRSNQALSAG